MDKLKVDAGMLDVYRAGFTMFSIPMIPIKDFVEMLETDTPNYDSIIPLRSMNMVESEMMHRSYSGRIWARDMEQQASEALRQGRGEEQAGLTTSLAMFLALEKAVEAWLLSRYLLSGLELLIQQGKSETHMVMPIVHEGQLWMAGGSNPEVREVLRDKADTPRNTPVFSTVTSAKTH